MQLQFIGPFSKYLLRTFCVTGTILEIIDTKERMHSPCPEGASSSAEKWQDMELGRQVESDVERQ